MGKKSAADRSRDSPAAQHSCCAEGRCAAAECGGSGGKSWKPAAALVVILAMVCVPFVVSVYAAPGGGRNEAKPMDDATRERYREAAKEMFYHSYDSYLQHAFPKDELAPISCKGHDTHNCHGCLLTFYDALDTLVVLENRTEFQRVVRWLAEHGAAAFDRDQSVSVFETNIRVLGSLISNHLLAKKPELNLMPDYNDELLTLAVDLGNRLLRAYMTPHGLPYGSISLKTGPRCPRTATHVESCTLYKDKFVNARTHVCARACLVNGETPKK